MDGSFSVADGAPEPAGSFTPGYSSPKPQNDEVKVSTESEQLINPDSIFFSIPSSAVGNRELVEKYGQVKERAVATMVRDLIVVIGHWIRWLSDAFPVEAVTTLDFGSPEGKNVPTRGMNEVLEKLQSLQILFNMTMDGEFTHPVSINFNVGHRGVEYKSIGGWPTNRSGKYLTRLVCRYSGFISNLEPQQFEIVDYCLQSNSTYDPEEAIFLCHASGPLLRKNLMSLDYKADIEAEVVDAWASLCIHTFKEVGRVYRTCLRVASKRVGETEELDQEQVDIWIAWIKQHDIAVELAEFVFIPMSMENHYNLLFVNFRTRTIQHIDTEYSSDRSGWDAFAQTTLSSFWSLLENCGDDRAKHRDEFKVVVIHPHWSKITHDPDSGITVMRLIDLLGEPESELELFRLQEEHVIVKSRMDICSAIVVSSINVERETVLNKVHEFVYKKNDGSLQPSRDMINFRNKFCLRSGRAGKPM